MNAKAELLRAAAQVVLTRGSGSLTLDAVAGEAGISKGGLLYHFPSKKALIAGMVSQAVVGFERALAAAELSGDWLEGFVEATLADLDAADPLSGVLAAIAEDPDLLRPFREAVQRWYQRAQTDYGVDAVSLLLALDALWFHHRLGTWPSVDREAVGAALRRQARACRPLREARR